MWLPEILPYLTGSAQALAASNSNGDGPSQPARMILVGTKLDLREGKPEAQRDMCVSTEEGEQLAHSIKADMYIECSAKAETNVKRVFDEAVKAFLKVFVCSEFIVDRSNKTAATQPNTHSLHPLRLPRTRRSVVQSCSLSPLPCPSPLPPPPCDFLTPTKKYRKNNDSKKKKKKKTSKKQQRHNNNTQ